MRRSITSKIDSTTNVGAVVGEGAVDDGQAGSIVIVVEICRDVDGTALVPGLVVGEGTVLHQVGGAGIVAVDADGAAVGGSVPVERAVFDGGAQVVTEDARAVDETVGAQIDAAARAAICAVDDGEPIDDDAVRVPCVDDPGGVAAVQDGLVGEPVPLVSGGLGAVEAAVQFHIRLRPQRADAAQVIGPAFDPHFAARVAAPVAHLQHGLVDSALNCGACATCPVGATAGTVGARRINPHDAVAWCDGAVVAFEGIDGAAADVRALLEQLAIQIAGAGIVQGGAILQEVQDSNHQGVHVAGDGESVDGIAVREPAEQKAGGHGSVAAVTRVVGDGGCEVLGRRVAVVVVQDLTSPGACHMLQCVKFLVEDGQRGVFVGPTVQEVRAQDRG